MLLVFNAETRRVLSKKMACDGASIDVFCGNRDVALITTKLTGNWQLFNTVNLADRTWPYLLYSLRADIYNYSIKTFNTLKFLTINLHLIQH